MHAPTDTPGGAAAADDAGLRDAAAAARERQSHVRHELRGPLAVMYPLLSLLRDDDALTPRQRDHLEVLDRNVTRLEALITSAAESGWTDCSAAPPVPVVVALGDVAEQTVAMRRRGEAAGPRVDVSAGPRPGARAWADEDDVRQIVADLVANAAAYTPPTGAVTVRVAPGAAPATVELVVADDGPGVPPEELSRVFDFGFRGQRARDLGVPGLGAGLWVCRELARRNGGAIRLESPPGAGVTVTVVLPAAGAHGASLSSVVE